jgi:hypothetical protein
LLCLRDLGVDFAASRGSDEELMALIVSRTDHMHMPTAKIPRLRHAGAAALSKALKSNATLTTL